jgi:hypothetical protein
VNRGTGAGDSRLECCRSALIFFSACQLLQAENQTGINMLLSWIAAANINNFNWVICIPSLSSPFPVNKVEGAFIFGL